MNFKTKLLVILILSISPLSYLTACTCGSIKFETELQDMSQIFTGVVISTESYVAEISGNDINYLCTTFQIHENFKGNNHCTISIITEPDDASCGYSFTKDSTYLVFAYSNFYQGSEVENYLSTGLCTRTGNISYRKDDIRKLSKLGDNINRLSALSPEVLYGEIWKDEYFMVTDTDPQACLGEEEINKRMHDELVYCESDSVFPTNDIDSMFFTEEDWEYIVNKVEMKVIIDAQGDLIHSEKAFGKMNNENCIGLAAEFIKNWGVWTPGTINGQAVKTSDYITVDFGKLKAR